MINSVNATYQIDPLDTLVGVDTLVTLDSIVAQGNIDALDSI